MSQITLAAALNFLGLAMVALGVSMLLVAPSLVEPVAVAALTTGGVGLILLSTLLLVGLMLSSSNREERSWETDDAQSATAIPVPLRHQDQLINAMEELRDSALDLIERRREIHHLNIHRWHYAHRDETSQEIAAHKRYRQAKSALDLHRLSLPTEFWVPVDNFCDAIDLSLSRDVYSAPKDRQVYDNFVRLWHSTMRQINEIVSGRPAPEEAHQLAD
ncbi:MAG TPA: hypothetical protein VFA32_13560 [Dehalococcoidia bacterium]|jgi:hypothetical protein|nr:hypothetical protein [Dehalococcoidia bacterium]